MKHPPASGVDSDSASLIARLLGEAAEARLQSAQLRRANEQLLLALLRDRTELDATIALRVDSADAIGTDAPSGDVEKAGANRAAAVETERLHVQVREANGSLVAAVLHAQELQAVAEGAYRQQSEFLAKVAHELRNPLMPLSIATTRMANVGPEERARLQVVVHRQVQQMTRLIGDLLDSSRARTGKLRLERGQVDLIDLVEFSVEGCLPAMQVRKQNLTLDIPAQAVLIFADRARLVQVLSNLLDNASKYTPEGGEIGLSLSLVDKQVTLVVHDSGIGISALALPHVFDALVQDPQAVSFNGLGLGLGLAVVHEIIQAHGGTVQALSAGHGLGSRFEITLTAL